MDKKKNRKRSSSPAWRGFLIVMGLALVFVGGCSSSDDDNDAPVADITSPVNGDTYKEGVPITLGGTGNDKEDGSLSGDALAWTSDRDGDIGTGASLTRNDLSPGTHTLTLTVRDSDGSAASQSVNITVSESLKITRDAKGVWFVTGPDDASLHDVYEAMGYAIATDRLWQAEKYRRTARGRLAEIFGQDQLPSDIFIRTTGYSDEELDETFEGLNSESQDIIRGYVAGFNRRIAEVRADSALLPFEFKAMGANLGSEFVPEDWTIRDVLSWMALLLRFFDGEGTSQGQIDNAAVYQELAIKFPEHAMAMFQDLRWGNDSDAPTYIPDSGTGTGRSKASSPLTPLPQGFPDLRAVAGRMAETREVLMENLKKINAYVKMGSYAWVVGKDKTESGNPIIYSGPQMDHGFRFSAPSIVTEGSVRAGGLNISGMTVPGIPGIIIGRTPHHAWSMQVGHARTVDYYIEDPSAVSLHRMETIRVAGGADVELPVFRTSHGPVVNPLPYDPTTYTPDPANPIIAWKYAHWGYELNAAMSLFSLARASSMDEFAEGIELVAVSQHFCYADRDGNIAYWMSGRDPVRPAGEYRFPQGFMPGSVPLEWDAAVLIPRSTDRNTSQGFYGGWNSKTSSGYGNSANNASYFFGPFHRGHIIMEYLSDHDSLTFEDVRDLALYIATTDSLSDFETGPGTYGDGGNPWEFVKNDFSAAVQANPDESRNAALAIFEGWDGHFVEGGKSEWAAGTTRADPWLLMNKWIREVIRLTFDDELGETDQRDTVLFSMLLHGLPGTSSHIVNNYNWFQNLSDADAPQTGDDIIVQALDNVLATLGDRPWGINARGNIEYTHEMIGVVHSLPVSSRSTYAHCVEFGASGPVRIESMLPLGESGNILMDADGAPVFDEHFLGMTDVYDNFAHRAFPLFD
ncbi:MAG: penicillin acylase [Desulfobacteraceae bacterium 4572_88]|nr:MAG: penicillin acylase [Desulfobacteraceae bacterium 4572_88]